MSVCVCWCKLMRTWAAFSWMLKKHTILMQQKRVDLDSLV